MRWGRVFVIAFAVSAMSCLAPTEIILVLSTDVACAVVAQNGVAIALGAPGDDDSGVATKTFLCAGDGGIGTAVLLPHSSVDQAVGIRVTLGVDAAADQCPPPDFPGCIVARRSLRFDPHTPLTLPIDLDQSCIGVPCTPDSTCVSGACVDAGVECDGAACGIPEDGGGVIDAGPIDAGPIDAGPCQTVNDVLVQSGTGTAAPRVTVSGGAWGVAWQTMQSGIQLAEVSALANNWVITQPIDVVGANSAALLGPLGSDGASYAFSYSASNNTTMTIVAPDGTQLIGTPLSLLGLQPGSIGMIPLGPPMTYATSSIVSSNANAFLTSFSTTSNSSSSGNINATGITDITLVKGGSTYYATTVDQNSACGIYSCAYGSQFTCAPLTSPPSPCNGIRVAEGLGKLSHVVVSNKVPTFDGTYSINGTILGAQFQYVATSDLFHLVFVTAAHALAITPYDGKSTPGPTAQYLTQGLVQAIDVVADGPNSPGFAIVYTLLDSQSVTSVHFMHLCQ